MRRSTRTLLALALLAAATPAPGQVSDTTDAAAQASLASSYWTFGGLYFADNREYELMAVGGQAWPFGATGGWTLRAGLGAGVSFYGANDTGLLGGAQLGMERTLTGDRLQLQSGRPLEVYALVGGAAYAGWNLAEAPEVTELVPAISFGVGIRWRGTAAREPMVTLELYHEERLEDFDSRLYLRFDYLHPRGVPRPNPPSPAQP